MPDAVLGVGSRATGLGTASGDMLFGVVGSGRRGYMNEEISQRNAAFPGMLSM